MVCANLVQMKIKLVLFFKPQPQDLRLFLATSYSRTVGGGGNRNHSLCRRAHLCLTVMHIDVSVSPHDKL